MQGDRGAHHLRVSARARDKCWPLSFVSCAIVEFVSVGSPCALWTSHETSVFHEIFRRLWSARPPQRNSCSHALSQPLCECHCADGLWCFCPGVTGRMVSHWHSTVSRRHGRRRAPSANRRVQVLPLCSTVFCALLHTRSIVSDVASVSRHVGGFLDEVPSEHKKRSCPTRDRFERLSLAAVLIS